MSIKSEIDYRKNYRANLLSNVALFFLNIIIGIFLPSFFIRTLGVDNYGIIAMGTSLYAYVTIITVSVDGALARFLMLDMQKDDLQSINCTFNTGFWMQLFSILFVILPGLLLFTFKMEWFLNIPPQSLKNAKILFAFMAFSFAVLIVAGVFASVSNAYNKVYLKNIGDRITLLTYALLSPVFILVVNKSLAFIGLAYMLGAIGTLVYSIMIWRRLSPYLVLSVKNFRVGKLKEIFGLGGWLVVNQIAAVLFLNMDLFVINSFMNANEVGKYAAIMRWSSLIRTLGAVASAGIGSTLVLLYAQEKIDKMIKVSKMVVKLMAIFLAFPIGIICGYARPLLLFWLGPAYVSLYPLMIVMTVHLIVNVSVVPLFSVFQAYNKAKVPGILTVFLGIFNVLLSITLIKYTSLGLYAVAIAGLLVLTSKNLVFTTIYTARLFRIKNDFIRTLLPGIATLLIIVFLAKLLNFFIGTLDLYAFILSACVVVLFSALITYKFIFSAEDRNFVFNIISRRNVNSVSA
jgi:membrane protein EpsK